VIEVVLRIQQLEQRVSVQPVEAVEQNRPLELTEFLDLDVHVRRRAIRIRRPKELREPGDTGRIVDLAAFPVEQDRVLEAEPGGEVPVVLPAAAVAAQLRQRSHTGDVPAVSGQLAAAGRAVELDVRNRMEPDHRGVATCIENAAVSTDPPPGKSGSRSTRLRSE